MKNKNKDKEGFFGVYGEEKPSTDGFFGYDPKADNFCLEYGESLAEGDLRPVILEDFEGDEDE